MIIKAVKFAENGFVTQPFAFGGEDGMDKFDPSVKYRSSLPLISSEGFSA